MSLVYSGGSGLGWARKDWRWQVATGSAAHAKVGSVPGPNFFCVTGVQGQGQ